MSLIVSKEKLIFNQPPYTITIYKQDIKKIAIFYINGINPTGLLVSSGFMEVGDQLLAKNLKVDNEYGVILKVITDKKEMQSKHLGFAKIIHWLTNNLSFTSTPISISGYKQDSTSVMGRAKILQALNDLKNNGYPVDHLFPIFHALYDKPTVAENIDSGFKKHYKKFIALFWIILGVLALLLITLIIIK